MSNMLCQKSLSFFFLVGDCKRMLDVTFILDCSDSIGPVAFRTIKSYTKQILNELDLSHCDNIGIIKFGDYVFSEMFLGTPETKTNIFARIDAMEEPTKHVEREVNESKIVVALKVANGLMFTRQLGLRNKSEKVRMSWAVAYNIKLMSWGRVRLSRLESQYREWTVGPLRTPTTSQFMRRHTTFIQVALCTFAILC